MAEQIEKIYSLKEIGGEDLLSMLSAINEQFAKKKRTKQALNKESIKASIDEDSDAVNKLKQRLDELKIKEAELKIERQTLINQSKQQQLVRQQEIAQQNQYKMAMRL